MSHDQGSIQGGEMGCHMIRDTGRGNGMSHDQGYREGKWDVT